MSLLLIESRLLRLITLAAAVLLSGCTVVVGEQPGNRDAPDAATFDIAIGRAGDLGDHVDGFFGCRNVGVEIPIPVFQCGIAPTQRERLQTGFDRETDQALLGRQIIEVELVDLRWHHSKHGVGVDVHGVELEEKRLLLALLASPSLVHSSNMFTHNAAALILRRASATPI